MTTPTPRNRADLNVALLIEENARLYPLVVAHVDRERAMIDGYPSGSDEPRVSHTAELTPTEHAAEQRLRLDRHLADIEAGRHLIHVTVRDVHRALLHLLGMRITPEPADDTPHPLSGPRCDGGDADCENYASGHTLTSGHRHTGLCDDCWTKACHICGKQAEGRKVDGTQACGTCYKRDLRSRTKGEAA